MSELSVVLPAYNEEEAVGDVVRKTYIYLKNKFKRFEILVVNDGSTDRTRDVVMVVKEDGCPHVRLVEHVKNRGYGEALRSGFKAARYDWIFLMDADGQFDIGEIDKFLSKANQFEVVIGYRQKRADGWWRAIMTWGYMQIVRLIFDLRVRDAGCAFKLFKRDSWQQAQPITARDHKIFSIEWLWKLQRMGYEIEQLPVVHYPRVGGVATGARWDVVLAMLGEMVRLRVRG